IESFLSTVIDEYGKRFIPTENGGTWYSQSCKFFKLEHHIHFLYTKMRKTALLQGMQYIKDITDNLMITFHSEEKL
ncbi:MAG: hypothetical protein ABJB76_11455, partial [Candidatus Nitrosocosmicus sp.]